MKPAAHRAYVALGSNIDAERNLPRAVRLLGEVGHVAACSQVWQSAPVGYAEQADFLNAAVLLETRHSAADLIRCVLPDIERRLLRERNPLNKNGPRTIDLDLVLYDDLVGRVCGKPLPDPALLEYAFVARPVAELAAASAHPATGELFADIAARLCAAARLVLRADVVLVAGHAAALPRG